MHAYEVEGHGKVVVALAVISFLAVWLLHEALGAIDFEPQWWLGVPSFAGCYSGLYWLIQIAQEAQSRPDSESQWGVGWGSQIHLRRGR